LFIKKKFVMKKAVCITVMMLLAGLLLAQPGGKKKVIGIGIKGGLNFANITNAGDINGSSRTGFMGGLFFAPPSKSIISSRTELIYSRQGYNFKTNTVDGSVDLDYIVLPQLMGINITRFVQLQIGAQMAYLLNAKADSSKPASANNPYASLMEYYNRFDYGAAAGIEIYPVKNLLIGARFNISFGKLYKDPSEVGNGSEPPSFFPRVDAKNNVVMVFAGIRF
jgi:hypothetical protein